jgi:hypothetical protein
LLLPEFLDLTAKRLPPDNPAILAEAALAREMSVETITKRADNNETE